MFWVLLGIVTFLVFMYFRKDKKASDYTLSTKDVDHFIVTSILSTLFAHGILTLTQQEELESLSLEEIGGILTDDGFLQSDDWNWFVSDHIELGNIYVFDNDLDFG